MVNIWDKGQGLSFIVKDSGNKPIKGIEKDKLMRLRIEKKLILTQKKQIVRSLLIKQTS